ncbi:MAG: YajD family HNH nuclease [Deferrisomatales bacterium]|nr:YajD family HNH nuclease [Deferrisomatales bacterium]
MRELKQDAQKPKGEDYRARSLKIHGDLCGRCGREFAGKNLKLLTVHHRDGNHHNNPPDGSNWENLCVYCHDDAHSREAHGNYVGGVAAQDDRRVVYRDEADAGGGGGMADLLRRALEKKSR